MDFSELHKILVKHLPNPPLWIMGMLSLVIHGGILSLNGPEKTNLLPKDTTIQAFIISLWPSEAKSNRDPLAAKTNQLPLAAKTNHPSRALPALPAPPWQTPPIGPNPKHGNAVPTWLTIGSQSPAPSWLPLENALPPPPVPAPKQRAHIPRSRSVQKETSPAPTPTGSLQAQSVLPVTSSHHTDRSLNTPSSDAEPSSERLKAILQQLLKNRFPYPNQARRRHLEGQVVVSFRLTPAGNLLDPQILSSSGHALLDNATLDRLRQLETVVLPDNFTLSKVIEISLPIQYRLTP